MNPIRIFISSVQSEFAQERKALRDYLHEDPLLRRFFDVFLFENVPASDRRPDQLYLDEVERCDLYVGLFGGDYGAEDAEGYSPTEREFDRATERGVHRLIFLKNLEDSARHPKMRALIGKAQSDLVRRRFHAPEELKTGIYAALVEYLEVKELIRRGPFDAAPCAEATLDDLDLERMARFVRTARRARQFPLTEDVPPEELLTHLNLLNKGRPTNAAVLLFGKAPQRFLIASEIKCAHFHGVEVAKPIPSYQIYKGTVFQLVDQAVDFVLGKIDRAIGTRAEGVQAPRTYEIPPEVVTEAIVNAVAHRDYTDNGSVQVMLFADRLEVRNPGRLPPPLTFDMLRTAHRSIPGNPLLAEPLYLAEYIERMGTGTLDMIRRCVAAGLPEPEFSVTDGFITTVSRLDRGAVPESGADTHESTTETTQKTTQKTTQETTQETTQKTTQERILTLLATEPRITRRKLAKRLGISPDGAKYHLNKLRAAGIIQHVGPDKGGHWEIFATTQENTVPTPETTQKTTQKTTPETTQERILSLLATEPEITRHKLAKRLGITSDGVKYHLDKLRAAGIIQRIGPAKGGRWEVRK